MMLMYDTTPIPESKLPPVYVRKEHKRLKMDPLGKTRHLRLIFLRHCFSFFRCHCMLFQQLPEKRRRAMESRSFLHAPSSKRLACWRFAGKEKTRRRTSPWSNRRPLPNRCPRWLNPPWRRARTTLSGLLVRTGPYFRYWPPCLVISGCSLKYSNKCRPSKWWRKASFCKLCVSVLCFILHRLWNSCWSCLWIWPLCLRHTLLTGI